MTIVQFDVVVAIAYLAGTMGLVLASMPYMHKGKPVPAWHNVAWIALNYLMCIHNMVCFILTGERRFKLWFYFQMSMGAFMLALYAFVASMKQQTNHFLKQRS